ncbi:MAG: hypothetical protein ACM3ZA_13735 [Bacillota bacterium]
MRIVTLSRRIAVPVLALAALTAALWAGVSIDRPLSYQAVGVAVSGAWGSGEGQFGQGAGRDGLTYGPHSFAVDGAGTVYVLDGANQRLQRFNRDGKLTGLLALQGANGASLQGADDLTVDGQGGIWLVDNLRGRLAYFQPGGQLHELRLFGETRGALLERAGQIQPLSRGVLWSLSVITSEEALYQVKRVGAYGQAAEEVFRTSLSKMGTGGPLPTGLAVAGDQTFLLLPVPGEPGAALVKQVSADGQGRSWKVPALDEADLRLPAELLGLDGKGRTYLGVWAKGSLHLRVFDPSGQMLVRQVLPAGREPRSLAYARVSSAGELYLADLGAAGYTITRYRPVQGWRLRPAWTKP